MNHPLDEQTWHRMTEEITAGMRDWRLQHPKATLREIEHELDTRWARVRARMLEDLALASAATNWAATPDGQPPTCPDCSQPLQPRGLDTRTLQTHGGQALTFNRQYATCSACGAGLFCHATRNCQLSM